MVNRRPLLNSALVLGFGLGGFMDGIILHQILQWHHLVSSLLPMTSLEGLELNTLWDGLFHITMYVIVVIGLVMLWRAIIRPDTPHSPRTVIGGVLLGFGIFHIADSIINHWLLKVHHICYQNVPACDGGYFIIGLILMAVGALLLRAKPSPPQPQKPQKLHRRAKNRRA